MSGLDLPQFLGQLCGFLGFAVNVYRFQRATPQEMRLCNVFSLAFFALSYGLLGSLTAMWLCLFAAIRSLCLLKITNTAQRWGVFLLTFLTSVYIAGTHHLQGYELLAFAGVLLGGIADVQTYAARMRTISFAGHFTWLFFNLAIGSYGAVASNIMVIVSNGIGFYRFRTPLTALTKPSKTNAVINKEK